MRSLDEISVQLKDAIGRSRGELHIQLLPHQSAAARLPPLIESADDSEPPIQLLEEEEYLFEVKLFSDQIGVVFEPTEAIALDHRGGMRGRLRPKLSTGSLLFEVIHRDEVIASAELEVRSRKLAYRQEYRWMLRDIAESAAELIMQRFAASSQRVVTDSSRNAMTIYQRFEFLQGLLLDNEFQSAIRRVLTRPYESWVPVETERPIQAGVPAGGSVIAAIRRPGPRELTPLLQVPAAPRRLVISRTAATRNNAPNQFVKYALTTWRDLAAETHSILSRAAVSGPVMRGRREARALRDSLDAILASALFREVESMRRFPAENQVLQKREGYRDIFRLFVQTELAAQLSWARTDEEFSAGQHNVAILYEYWVFLQLGQVAAEFCGQTFSTEPLLELSKDGFTLALRRGREIALTGTASRNGRRIRIELWYNRRFNRARGAWANPMQPDCSVLFTPADDTVPHFEPVWLHFDAKYRIENVRQLFRPDEENGQASERASAMVGTAKADDILKMHSYRDAIWRSAGAYVIYPGDEIKECREYEEILPGIGAFPLAPTAAGAAAGRGVIREFFDQAIDHVAEQVSQHERARFWTAKSFDGRRSTLTGVPAVPRLRRPPADTLVLLGYVRSMRQYEWIKKNRLYNLRGGSRTGAVALQSRELASEIVLLYGPGVDKESDPWRAGGRPRLVGRQGMLDLDYPEPRGTQYFCLPIVPAPELVALSLSTETVQRVVTRLEPEARVGVPMVVTLESLWRSLERESKDQ